MKDAWTVDLSVDAMDALSVDSMVDAMAVM